MQYCEECSFVYDDLDRVAIPDAIRRSAPRFAAAVGCAPDPDHVRVRPDPDRWSALEYVCHVRDVLTIQHERLQRALTEDRPSFPAMARERRVVDDRYNEQDPDATLAELHDAAERLAAAFESLDDRGWARTGICNWPERTERNMAWLGRHTVHELIHHLGDIQQGLERIVVPSLNGRRFSSRDEVAGGEVGRDTVFHYHQDGDLIWARYAGGAIRRGHLVGTRTGDVIDFRYVHVNEAGETASGHCRSQLGVTDEGRIRMDETWQWESREGGGTSVVVELLNP